MASEELVGLRVAIYARFSSEGQRESSIEDQVRRCREFVLSKGGTVREQLVFADRGISGAGTDRPAYEQMMRLITNKPRELDVIVIEDLSRLSRAAADLFTLQRLFEFLEVRLIGVADGIDTFAKHSTLTFGLKSLVSAIYLDDLRDKTLRGLEGRALAGFATGGVCFGYSLRKEFGPGGKPVGTRIEIADDQAKVIRRIFKLYLDGNSFAAIAKLLNSEKIPPPRVHAKNRRVGWKDSTIRAMLHNESYVGRWHYKARQWRKVPGTNRRLPFRRDRQREIVDKRPHLRIIDEPTWTAVQQRLQAVRRFYTRTETGKPKGMAVPGRRTVYLFSSLLCCGVCGGKMVISGGSNDAYYRCEAHARRGVCNNDLSVRESVVRAGLLDELRRRLTSDRGIAYARKMLVEKLAEVARQRDAEVGERRRRIEKLTQQIDQLVDYVADGHGTAAVADKLRALEAERDSERAAFAVVEGQLTQPIKLPAPEDLYEVVFDLDRRLMADVAAGREQLRRLFRDGRITMLPKRNGFVARTDIIPPRSF